MRHASHRLSRPAWIGALTHVREADRAVTCTPDCRPHQQAQSQRLMPFAGALDQGGIPELLLCRGARGLLQIRFRRRAGQRFRLGFFQAATVMATAFSTCWGLCCHVMSATGQWIRLPGKPTVGGDQAGGRHHLPAHRRRMAVPGHRLRPGDEDGHRLASAKFRAGPWPCCLLPQGPGNTIRLPTRCPGRARGGHRRCSYGPPLWRDCRAGAR